MSDEEAYCTAQMEAAEAEYRRAEQEEVEAVTDGTSAKEALENLNEVVFTGIGEASMCWDPKPGDQVFDSSKASEIGERIMAAIRARFDAQAKEIEALKKAVEDNRLIREAAVRQSVSSDDARRQAERERDELRAAVYAAYVHLDRYGAVNSHEEEIVSQQRIFDMLRPFVYPEAVKADGPFDAEKAYAEAPEVPLTTEQKERIVERVMAEDRARPKPLPPEEHAKRAPSPLHVLLDADPSPVHLEGGKLLKSQPLVKEQKAEEAE